MPKIRNLLSEAKAAKFLGVSYWTLRRWRLANQLNHYQIGGRYFYSSKQLEEFIYSCECNNHAKRKGDEIRGLSKIAA